MFIIKINSKILKVFLKSYNIGCLQWNWIRPLLYLGEREFSLRINSPMAVQCRVVFSTFS